MAERSQTDTRDWSRTLGLLRNFWVNIGAIGLGIATGLLAHEFAKSLIPLGRLYVALLSMTVLPIVFSAIAHSVGQMLRSESAGLYLKRLVPVFAVTVVIGATVGVTGAALFKPGQGLNTETQHMLGRLLIDSGTRPEATTPGSRGLIGLLTEMVPVNVFRAFTTDKSLAVVFVSLLMGAAMGTSRSEAGSVLLKVMRGIYETFFKILSWALYGLPFGLFCLVAGQTTEVGATQVVMLGRIVLLFYGCCIVMCLLYVACLRFTTRSPLLTILNSLREPLTLSFVASNSLVAMPQAMTNMEEKLKQPQDVVRFVVPLGITMNRHAYPILFAMMTVFLAQMYGHSLSLTALLQIALAAAVVGMAAIGPAASVAPMMAMIVQPLGLPAGPAVAILVETTAVITPIVAMTHLLGSCATSSLIGYKGKPTN